MPTIDESILIYDPWGQGWKIQPDDDIWIEAKLAVDTASGEKVVWPLEKLVAGRGWGWWTVFKDIDAIEIELEREMLNPAKARLIEHNREYTPVELRGLLQLFGSNLAILHAIQAKTDAQGYALDESFKVGMKIAIKEIPGGDTIASKEGTILQQNALFKQTKRMAINHESVLITIKGWVKAYEAAYTAVSRMLSMDLGEMEMTSVRIP